jgi:hypothetical protein
MDKAQEEQEWVQAVRGDAKVGRGTCTSIDECFDDEELIERFRESKDKSRKEALDLAYEMEGLWREKGLEANCDSGEPLDEYWKERF